LLVFRNWQKVMMQIISKYYLNMAPIIRIA